MIKHFTAQGHSVHVCSIARSEQEAVEAEGISPYCSRYEVFKVHDAVQTARMVLRLPTMTPSSMGYFYSTALAKRVHAILNEQKIDLVFVHCSSVAQYVAQARHIPKILDFGDMDSQKWLEYARTKPFPISLGYLLEGKKLLREEARLASQFDLCTATTRLEWETLRNYGVNVDTDWFPNGVDSEYFSPGAEPYDQDLISFVGRMDYYPNQECMFDFCEHVLPRIRAKRPGVRLQIVGADPSPGILKLGHTPGVVVTGTVPDVRPLVRNSALTVAPLNIARGTQNKILESMAMGVPVVSSPMAAGGVDALADEHFLVGKGHQEFANEVLRILDRPAERKRLAESGRARMLANHSWGNSMLRLEEIVRRCLQARSNRKGILDLATEGHTT